MLKYSFDASAILDAWSRYYPIDLFPSFWDRFEEMCKYGIGMAIELIEREINKKDDGCLKWFKIRNLDNFFYEIDDKIQNSVSKILSNQNYQRLVEDKKGTFAADPFVIAFAQVKNLMVVTGEKASNNLLKPKIPDVCKDMGIECINILDLMRIEKWKF
jgi:predicted nuclease of predicted toxin-antitoxin system